MLFIRPETIDEGSLGYSSIGEVAPAAYNAGTTYAADAQVGVVTGSTVQLYRSVIGGNLNYTPASSPTWWTPDGVTYLAWNAGTTYTAGQKVLDATTHRVFESLVGANLNRPLTDPAWWADVEPANKWAMFDTYNTTQTVHPYRIVSEMTFADRIDSIALLNMTNANSVRVRMTTPTDGLVYDRTFPLVSTAGISSWFSYFFEAIEYKSDLFVSDLPAYLNPTVTVTIEGVGGGNVGVGVFSIGLAKDLGMTLHDGAQIGIIDYSRKTVDEFGNFQIIQRNFSRRGSFRCRIPKAAVDGVFRTLADYRTTPVVYSASTEYGATLIFGFFRDFAIEIDYPTESLVSIEIEGLT